MKSFYSFYFTLVVLFILTTLHSCKPDDPENILIDPENANELTRVLIMPDGAQKVNGSLPSPTGQNAPSVTSANDYYLSSNGSTAPLSFGYSGVSGNLRGCYAWVEGADQYFNLPYNGTSGSSGRLQLPLGIPTNVDEGKFTVRFLIYDANNRISNFKSVTIEVLRLGTGALQISLSWDNNTDQDLHVIDPSGEEIYFDNDTSPSGGILDRDDIDGFGPENIFWLTEAPDGTYTVSVTDYKKTNTQNNFFVTISGSNLSRYFSGSTIRGENKHVTTFRKRGNKITF